MPKPIIKGYNPEWGTVVGGLRTGTFNAIGTSPEIISRLLYVAISGTFSATVYLERYIGGAWTIVDTYTAPETVTFENPKALNMRLRCGAYTSGVVSWAIEDVYVEPTAIQGEPGQDGADGTDGIDGSDGATGPISIGSTIVYQTRTAAVAATIPSGAGQAEVIWTTGYSTAGDGGHGRYKRRGTAPSDTSNPAYIHSADGQWWELLPEAGEVRIEHFGGKADYSGSGSGGTDNNPPLTYAIAFAAGALPSNTYIGISPHRIRFGVGNYKFTQTWLLHNIVSIWGSYVGPDYAGSGWATKFYFRNTTGSAIVSFSGNTGPGENDGLYSPLGELHSAGGSFFGGFSIYGIWDGVTPMDHAEPFKAAMRIRCGGCTIDRVSIHAWQGHGYFIHGTNSSDAFPFRGNANQNLIISPRVRECAGHAYWVAGQDANANTFIDVQAEEVVGCGIIDSCTLGCSWTGGKIASYGHGVSKGGKWYQYLGPMDFNGPIDNVPGVASDTIWYYLGEGAPDGVNYLDYDALTNTQKSDFWLRHCPIMIENPYSSVVGMYNELGPVKCHTVSAAIVGGIIDWTHHSAAGQGVLYGRSLTGMPGSTGYVGTGPTANGVGLSYTKYGGASQDSWDNGPRIFKHGRPRDGDYELGYFGEDIYWLAPRIGHLMQITTASTAKKLSGNGPAMDRILFRNTITVGNKIAGSFNDGIVIGACSSGPPIDAGEYTTRMIFFDIDAAPGQPSIYKVTTAGVIKNFDWVTSTAYSLGAIVKADSNYYRAEASGTSITKPTHTSTSGPVTLNGIPWTYLGNTSPVFKSGGTLAA